MLEVPYQATEALTENPNTLYSPERSIYLRGIIRYPNLTS